jgi:hypothetical protein
MAPQTATKAPATAIIAPTATAAAWRHALPSAILTLVVDAMVDSLSSAPR